MISFYLPITPVPKARPRFNIAAGKVYTPNATRSTENKIALFARCEMNKRKLKAYDVPIIAYLVFHGNFAYHTNRHGADVDNLSKLVLDALNGIVYTDDRLIYALRAEKVYCSKPGITCTFDEYELSHNALGLTQAVIDNMNDA